MEINVRDVTEYLKCPKKAYYNKIREGWVKQVKLYLKLFPNADKVLVVDQDGKVLDVVKK